MAKSKSKAEAKQSDNVEPVLAPGVRKSPAGFWLSFILMAGWLLFLVYLAIRLGQ